MKKIEISLIAPAYNEAKNIKKFCTRANKALDKITKSYEIIVIDDGSTDKTFKILLTQKNKVKNLKIIRLRRQTGQAGALSCGINHAKGEIIIIIDADLQQDPADIQKLITPIKNNQADVVSGHRKKRKHAFVYKFIAAIERLLNKHLLGINLRDTAVSPNAYKKATLKDIDLFGEMHRFLVPMLFWRGYKVIEVTVPHYPRLHGQSKYKPTKALRGFLDLIIIKFWQDYSARPIHFFGTIGLALIFLGTIIGVEEAIRKLIFHLSIYNRTLPLLAAFLAIVGIQFLILGILADILIKIYYRNKKIYQIKKIID